MRQRLPLVLVSLMILTASLAAGCGSSDTPASAPANSTSGASSSTDSGKQSNSAGDAALKGAGKSSSGKSSSSTGYTKINTADAALNGCLDAAKDLPSSADRNTAKKRCHEIFDNNKNVSESISKAMAQAHAQCVQAANNIPDAQAKSSALLTCAKIK